MGDSMIELKYIIKDKDGQLLNLGDIVKTADGEKWRLVNHKKYYGIGLESLKDDSIVILSRDLFKSFPVKFVQSKVYK